jgi:hypothetical protein
MCSHPRRGRKKRILRLSLVRAKILAARSLYPSRRPLGGAENFRHGGRELAHGRREQGYSQTKNGASHGKIPLKRYAPESGTPLYYAVFFCFFEFRLQISIELSLFL